MRLFVDIAKELLRKRVFLVYGASDQSDEFSSCGETLIAEGRATDFKLSSVRPEDFGLQSGPSELVRGGDRERNVRHALEVLSGAAGGAGKSIVAMTAGAALYLAEHAPSLAEGVTRAREVIECGAAWGLLERMRRRCALADQNVGPATDVDRSD